MMFVRGPDVVGVHILILVQGVVVRLVMNVDVASQLSRYHLCRVCRIAVTVLRRCLSIIDLSS